MCLSTPTYTTTTTPAPTVAPTAQTSSVAADGNTALANYSEILRRRGLASTIRNTGTSGTSTSSGLTTGSSNTSSVFGSV